MSTPPKATPTTPLDDDPPQWAMQRAAQAWCASTTKHIEFDAALCREFAHILAEGLHAPPPAAQPSDAAGLGEVIGKAVDEHAEKCSMWGFDNEERTDLIDRILTALAPYLKGEPGDSELLDWLDRNRYMVDFNNEGTELNGPGHWQCTDGDHWGTGLHIRAAIKSAQRGEGKP